MILHKGWFYRSLLINSTCFIFSRSLYSRVIYVDSIILTLECLGFATKHDIFILAKKNRNVYRRLDYPPKPTLCSFC